MKIIRAKNYNELSQRAADIIAAQVILKPSCVLGLATGSSPLGVYARLVEKNRCGEISFRDVTTVNLDEYSGLAGTHEQSYRYFMQDNLFDHIDIAPANVHLPDGMAADPDKECRAYDDLIRSVGGIDLQLLGIGMDGHIGFNEPADCFQAPVHVVELDESTIDANKRFFGGDASLVPRKAFTMGIEAIMQAKKVILVVNGASKAEIVRSAFTGPITPKVPASILQLHPDFTLIGDIEALSLI